MKAAVIREVVHVSSNAERLPDWSYEDHIPLDELARRQGVKPITSADELVCPGIFDSDEELDEFLADLYASRRADLG